MKQGWETKRLGDVCLYIKEQGRYSDLPYIGMEDIESATNVFTGNLINRSVDSSTFRFKSGFVLYGRLRPYLRKVLIPSFDGHCSTEIFPIQTTEALKSEFLKHWFMLDSTVSLIESTCTGARMPRANMNNVLDFDIPIPSISEQERIVRTLDSALAKIEALRANAHQNLQNAKDLFQASLKQELTPKQSWKSKRLNEICEVKDGTHDSPKYVDEGIPFVTQKNITVKGFDIQDTRKIKLSDHEKFYKRSNVEYGDILISMIGANRGMSCIVDINDTFSIKNVGLVKQSDKIKQRYLLYYLQSPMSAKYVADASNGGAQEFIGLTALRAFPILFPENSEEQQAIVEKLDALSNRCQAMEENYCQTLTACNDLKQALLKKAFNGEL